MFYKSSQYMLHAVLGRKLFPRCLKTVIISKLYPLATENNTFFGLLFYSYDLESSLGKKSFNNSQKGAFRIFCREKIIG